MQDLKKLRFVFICPDQDYVNAMRRTWADPQWTFKVGRFQSITGYDTLITAGNSYGIMDGGLDLAVRDHLGYGVQDSVQAVIADQFCGLLPVGSAVSVQTQHPVFKHLIYAPTMRVPMDIRQTNYVFYAALAAFGAVKRRNEKPTGVIVPAFGALTGKMDPSAMTKQIKAAWLQTCNGRESKSWGFAMLIEKNINPKGF